MSALEVTAQEFKRAALARERAAASELLRAYRLSATRIERSVKELTSQIEHARAQGVDISSTWLYERARLISLKREIEFEINRFASIASLRVRLEQRAAIEHGRIDAVSLVGEATGDAVAVRFGSLNASAVEALAKFAGDGSPLRNLFASRGAQVAQSVADELVSGVATGAHPRVIASRVRTVLGGELSRALTISRTEVLRAYRAASLDSYKTSGVVTGYRWLCAKDLRTCLVCLALDGQVFPLTRPMPAHVNCLVGGAVVYGAKAKGSSTRWYAGEVFDIETADGNKLTVTPNHPILTSKGWLPARLIHEGGDVICGSLGDSAPARVNPDDHQIPALIEDIAQAVGRDAGVSAVSVPTSPEHFHGDGGGSEVSVIRSDSALRDGFNPALFEQAGEMQFVGRGVGLPELSRRRAPTPFGERNFAPAHGGMSGGRVSSVLGGTPLCHHHAVGGRLVAPLNAALMQDARNRSARNAVPFGERIFGETATVGARDGGFVEGVSRVVPQGNVLLAQDAVNNFVGYAVPDGESLARFAGSVSVKQVLKVRRRPFAGHVYNLETTTGWYVANGIITHNCRCSLTPIVAGQAPPQETAGEWFAKLSEGAQRDILKGAYEAYAKGKITLLDFVGFTTSDVWGTTAYRRPLTEILVNTTGE